MPIKTSRRDLLQSLLAGSILTALPGERLGASTVGVGLRQPPQIESLDGVAQALLDVQYTDPAAVSVGPYPTRVRSFNGRIPGPTLRVKQGDRLKVRLRNRLPPNLDDSAHHDSNVPGQFNTTNLHTHGLHVSPKLGSDYVFLSLEPETTSKSPRRPDSVVGTFDFEFKIPEDHPSGTFWYHPHRHGSTAIQIASGMAGALIVEPRDPAYEPEELRAVRDIVLVIQQIAVSLEDGIGVIEDFDELAHRDYPFLTVNGQILPRLQVSQGEVVRLRIINAHFHSAIRVGLVQNQVYRIASDGIYLPKMQAVEGISLAPGNREDILVKAPMKAGIYPIVTKHYEPTDDYDYRDGQPPAPPPPCPRVPGGRFLAYLEITDERRDMPLPQALPAPAGLPAIGDERIGRRRSFHFAFRDGKAVINGEEFSPDRIDQTFKLGVLEEWEFTADNGCHPFHIHVSPFQIVSVNGHRLTRPHWKDTVMIPNKGQVICRAKFEHFDGRFVLHCHRLKHEDLGMMQQVQTVF